MDDVVVSLHGDAHRLTIPYKRAPDFSSHGRDPPVSRSPLPICRDDWGGCEEPALREVVVRKRLQEELADSGMTGPAGKRPPFTGLILTIRTAESGRRAGTGAGPLLLLFADVGMLVHCGDPSLVANHTERGDRCGPAGALPTFSSCHAMD